LLLVTVPFLVSSHTKTSPPSTGIAILALMEVAGSDYQHFWKTDMQMKESSDDYIRDVIQYVWFIQLQLLMCCIAVGLLMYLLTRR